MQRYKIREKWQNLFCIPEAKYLHERREGSTQKFLTCVTFSKNLVNGRLR